MRRRLFGLGVVITLATVAGCGGTSEPDPAAIIQPQLEHSLKIALLKSDAPPAYHETDSVKNVQCTPEVGATTWECETLHDVALLPDPRIIWDVRVRGRCWRALRIHDDTGIGELMDKRLRGCL